MRSTKRTAFIFARTLISGSVLLALFALFVNLAWFDEPLHPDLSALSEPQTVSMQDNAYALALGFLAGKENSPDTAGRQIVEALRTKYEQGERIALDARETEAILGGSDLDQSWQGDFQSLRCNARLHLDCAERLIAEVAQTDYTHPRLSMLLDRYSAILDQMRFEENQEHDVFSPMPPYRELMDVGRLRLAISYENDSTPEFLGEAARDFEFWLRILRESDALAAKMVSLAGMQNNLDFLSTLMRHRELDEAAYRQLLTFLRPFSREESDIGEAFVSEARIAVLSEAPPVVMRSPWPLRLLVQENATLNEEYVTTFVPMRRRAALSAREYFRQQAYQPLAYHLRTFPPPFYNLGGKLARSNAWPDATAFISRVHDQNGRILLVLLQAEIERSPGSMDVRDVIETSMYRNPYTGDPMEYDADAKTIGFDCLHSVYHPPNPPDVCGVAIGSDQQSAHRTGWPAAGFRSVAGL